MKFLLKLASRLAGIVVLAAIVLTVTVRLTERADERYASDGAYSEAILVWEQSESGRGSLTFFGHDMELDLDSLNSFSREAKSKLCELFGTQSATSE